MIEDFSVIIPTYNRLKFLQQAISSCLEGNEGVRIQVIVIDDGSTDGTRDFLRGATDSRMAYILQESQGAQVARNHGLNIAHGKYIKFLDDDDWLSRDALRYEFEILEKTGEDFSCGTLKTVNEEGSERDIFYAGRGGDLLPQMLDDEIYTNPLRFSVRSELAKQLLWNPETKALQDAEYFWRIAALAKKGVSIDGTVGYVRKHRGARITSVNRLMRPIWHLRVLLQFVKEIQSASYFSHERKSAAARALWKWGHICLPLDTPLALEAFDFCLRTSPSFTPRRKTIIARLIDRIAGPKAAEHLFLPFRRLKQRITSRGIKK